MFVIITEFRLSFWISYIMFHRLHFVIWSVLKPQIKWPLIICNWSNEFGVQCWFLVVSENVGQNTAVINIRSVTARALYQITVSSFKSNNNIWREKSTICKSLPKTEAHFLNWVHNIYVQISEKNGMFAWNDEQIVETQKKHQQSKVNALQAHTNRLWAHCVCNEWIIRWDWLKMLGIWIYHYRVNQMVAY